MENKEKNAIKKIDEALKRGSIEGMTLTDDLREMLTRTKDIISKGMPLDVLVSLIETVNACIDEQEPKGGVINA